jgi:hypothetical protein
MKAPQLIATHYVVGNGMMKTGRETARRKK